MAGCLMLVGIPGAGKSYYTSKILEEHPEYINMSSDKIRERLYGHYSIQGNPQTVFDTMHKETIEHLKNDEFVIFDATNVNRKKRIQFIQMVKPYADYVDCVVVWASIDTCLYRDSKREVPVSKQVIDKFLHSWNSPWYDEGFRRITFVNTEASSYKDFTNAYYNTLIDDMNIPHENPHHTLDVEDHCLSALAWTENNLKEKLVGFINYHRPITIAARFHDCGKPYTKSYKEDGDGNKVAHYYQHDNVGGYMVYGLFREKFENFDAVMCSWIVCNHMQPFFDSKYYNSMRPSDKALIDFIHEADLNSH